MKEGHNHSTSDGRDEVLPQDALSSQQVLLLVRHLQPQLEDLFPPASPGMSAAVVDCSSDGNSTSERTTRGVTPLTEESADKDTNTITTINTPLPPSPPPPPPAGARRARAEGLDARLQLERSKGLRAAGDLLEAVAGFKQTVTLVRKRERTQRNTASSATAATTSAAQCTDGGAGVSLSEVYFLMGRCFEGERSVNNHAANNVCWHGSLLHFL